jgi:hypothetical protein
MTEHEKIISELKSIDNRLWVIFWILCAILGYVLAQLV